MLILSQDKKKLLTFNNACIVCPEYDREDSGEYKILVNGITCARYQTRQQADKAIQGIIDAVHIGRTCYEMEEDDG